MSTLQTLQDLLAREYRLTPEQVSSEALLSDSGLDSLSILELMFKIEDRFCLRIGDDTPTNLRTVNDVVRYIDGLIASQAGRAGPASSSKRAPV